MGEYQIYTHLAVVEALPKDRAQRMKIFRLFAQLSEAPNTEGDFKEKDRSLREQQVKIVGKYAVTYWFDSPVKTVMITALRLAD